MIALVGALFVAMGSVNAQAGPSVAFVSDTDGIVKAGTVVEAQLQNDAGEGQAATFTVQLGLLVLAAASGADEAAIAGLDFTNATRVVSVGANQSAYIYTKGAANGEYSIIASAGGKDYPKPLEVGEPGAGVASVEISLGKVGHATAATAATDNSSAEAVATDANNDNEGAPDTYTDCARDNSDGADEASATEGAASTDTVLESCIALTVTVKNSLGAKANPVDIEAIHLFAPLANIVRDNDGTDDVVGGTVNLGGGAASVSFFVAAGSSGAVDVTAIVLSKTGSTSSQPFPLNFTGSAASISVSEASSPLSQTGTPYRMADAANTTNCNAANERVESGGTQRCTEIKAVGVANFELTAKDKGGNAATPPTVGVSVKDSGGNEVGGSKINVADPRPKAGATLTHIIELSGAGAAAGTYMATFTFGGEKTTREIVVAGDAANIAMESDLGSVTIGDFVTVTATVTDKDGNLQPDAGMVTFTSVGALKLEPLDDADPDNSGAQRALNDGVATLEYAVVDGSGTATIIARLSGVRGVVTVSAAPVEEEAMPEEEASVACLSNLAGFATWACDVESSASEIFGLVSGRGATALHLWNGSAWVRYSVVDGTMVPGSSDFMVAENDILYISN